MLKLNILDYSPVDEGSTPRQALRETTELAQVAEQLGYQRFWVSEHHHIPSLAGSTPELLIMHLASQTKRIRIGSGGVMLPNYSPYKVAENFRMLEALYPGRIDLGIGSATGANRIATKALQTGKPRTEHDQQVADLLGFLTGSLSSEHPYYKLTVTPAIDTRPEVWLLGGGGHSAELAAAYGTPFTFAHFARPGKGPNVARRYRETFQPSDFLSAPKVMVAVFVVIAETAEQAEQLAKAFNLWLLFVESLNTPPYYPSIETAARRGFTVSEQEKVYQNRNRVLIGDAASVKKQIEDLADLYETDEVTIMPHITGHENRLNAIRLLSDAFQLAT